MTVHDPGSLGVGRTLTTHEFAIRPSDLTAHVESSFLGEVIGFCEECLSTGTTAAGSARSPAGPPARWGLVCPNTVAVDRVLAELGQHEALRDAPVIVRSVGRVRALGELVIGEPITASAEVRFRSRRNPGSMHLTVDVEVHHWHEGHRTTVLAFEAGLELHAEATAGPAAA